MIGQRASNQHIAALDGIRGIAALAVTFWHGLLHFNSPAIERVAHAPISQIKGGHDVLLKVLLMLCNGDAAVMIFFVLSGAVLGLSLAKAEGSFWQIAFDFILARLSRIYPAVIVCMAVFWLVFELVALAYHGVNWPVAYFLLNAALWNNNVHGATWSVQIEILAIPLILLAFWCRKTAGLWCLLGLAALTIAWSAYPDLAYPLRNLQIFAFAFVAGMVLADDRFSKQEWSLPKGALPLSALAFLLIRHLLPYDAPTGNIAQSLLGALLLFTAMADRNSAAHRFLVSPKVQLLGRISFSFYLLNVIFLNLAWTVISNAVADPGHNATGLGLASAVFATLVTIPLAILSEQYVERSGRRLGRRLRAVRVQPE